MEGRVGVDGAAGPGAEDADAGDDGGHRLEVDPGDRDRVGVARLVAARGAGQIPGVEEVVEGPEAEECLPGDVADG